MRSVVNRQRTPCVVHSNSVESGGLMVYARIHYAVQNRVKHLASVIDSLQSIFRRSRL
jgi:hypothetical protein